MMALVEKLFGGGGVSSGLAGKENSLAASSLFTHAHDAAFTIVVEPPSLGPIGAESEVLIHTSLATGH
jgi:hypothetical protein